MQHIKENTLNMPPHQSATAALILSNGLVLWGKGFGAYTKETEGELCFCTSMTGYQESLTDPSYADQIIMFTFPHIGNVGANTQDHEAPKILARGLVVKEDITAPSNWRSEKHFIDWLKEQKCPGICGIDTRYLTQLLRKGNLAALITFPEDGHFNIPLLKKKIANFSELSGAEIASKVAQPARHWTETTWDTTKKEPSNGEKKYRVVALDFGAKDNILRSLVKAGCDVHVLPGTASAQEILELKPDGLFLSNGPGDPSKTAEYTTPILKKIISHNIAIFGICLGHQLLAHLFGGKTYKLPQGHRGTNQPVKNIKRGTVEITSQNHGFAVDSASLPSNVKVTHISLFDGSNEGIEHKDYPIFSVQYHPEASPGPTDSFYLFENFVSLMKQNKPNFSSNN